MFPFRDHNPSGRTPFVTWALVAINIAVFLAYWTSIDSERALFRFFTEWGTVPYLIIRGENWDGLVTSMFLHGGWMHLAGNMLFLWVFGDNIEDELGHVRFLGFYLLAGLAAAALQIAAEPSSRIPMVGASGAIAGVLGGYLLLFPKARIDVLIIFVVFFRVVPIPAWIVLGAWFAIQLIDGFGAAGSDVAHWAHVGGFIAGLALVLPAWRARGGRDYWARTHGVPPHPETRYARSRIPVVARRR